LAQPSKVQILLSPEALSVPPLAAAVLKGSDRPEKLFENGYYTFLQKRAPIYLHAVFKLLQARCGLCFPFTT
jgi:hypothetical protein